MNNFIALVVFTLCFSTAIGGILLALATTGRRRWSSGALAVLAILLAALLALMSSKYWFGDQVFFNSFINIELVSLITDTTQLLAALFLGGAMTALIWWLFTRSLQHERWWLHAIGAGVVLVAAFSVGTTILAFLSVPEAEKDTSPVGRELEVKEGFRVELFSTGSMISPTVMAFGPDGLLYIGDIRGRIWRITISQGPGATPQLFASGYHEILGLTWHKGELFVASLGTISVISDSDADGKADQRRDIVKDLPVRLFPLHQNNNIRFGPDERLYFGLGAGHNSEAEVNAITGTIVSVKADGSDLQVVARGLRNAYAVAFNAAGDLFATENGPQGIPVIPGDELNHIEAGKSYGYPTSYDLPSPNDPSVGPVYLFPPHASPNGLMFYTGSVFPAEYLDNAFVTSWMRGEVYRLRLSKSTDGVYAARAMIFARGFKNPMDIVEGPDGSLYITDFGVNSVYRISRT